jgi:hypothetical protein
MTRLFQVMGQVQNLRDATESQLADLVVRFRITQFVQLGLSAATFLVSMFDFPEGDRIGSGGQGLTVLSDTGFTLAHGVLFTFASIGFPLLFFAFAEQISNEQESIKPLGFSIQLHSRANSRRKSKLDSDGEVRSPIL